MLKTIKFKSLPEYFIKEKSGLKPNTIRFFEKSTDDRLLALNKFKFWQDTPLMIEITNTDSGKIFTRVVSDVSPYHDFYIISWFH